MEQLGVAQIRPQGRRDRVPQELRISLELIDIARSGEDRRDGWMSEWKLQRRGDERHPMTVADGLYHFDPADDLGRRRPIVPSLAAGENAGIERRPDYDRYPGSQALGKQVIERRLLEERIAPGKKKDVPITPIDRLEQNFPFVDPDPDRPPAGRMSAIARARDIRCRERCA